MAAFQPPDLLAWAKKDAELFEKALMRGLAPMTDRVGKEAPPPRPPTDKKKRCRHYVAAKRATIETPKTNFTVWLGTTCLRYDTATGGREWFLPCCDATVSGGILGKEYYCQFRRDSPMNCKDMLLVYKNKAQMTSDVLQTVMDTPLPRGILVCIERCWTAPTDYRQLFDICRTKLGEAPLHIWKCTDACLHVECAA